MYLLTLLAFYFHQIFELTDGVYQACRLSFGTKSHLWENFRATIRIIIVEDWVVVNSKAAGERATKTMGRQTDRTKEKLDKVLFHLQAQRFICKEDALKTLAALSKRQKYHQLTKLD
jgi:hypothetical protein